MSLGNFEIILIVLFTALVVSVIFRRFRIPFIISFLLVGAALGPHGLALIPDLDTIKKLAEFGIVFLMFTVGLEFSKPKLFALKKAVFVIGGLQVLLSILISMGIGILLGMSMLSALVVGSIVAMSSTAIVIKQLDEQFELYSNHGLNAIGILLFQDLAVILLMILIVSFSTNDRNTFPIIFLWALLKGTLAIILIIILGRWLLRPMFRLIASTQVIELFTLTVLLITLSAAWVTNLFGLSFSLGAFLAGMMLSETEFRHQIETEIRPFRDILLGLFFISIGMLADVTVWYNAWLWIALLLCALTIGKMFLIILISRLAGNNSLVSLRTGLILAQGGEFGFAILTLAISHQILPFDYSQVVLAALLISIVISPLLIYFNESLSKWILPKASPITDEFAQEQISQKITLIRQHVIICGFGRVGQQIGKILKSIHYPYIGLDINPELIKETALIGENVIFGDATHPNILKSAGLKQAKAIIISFDKLKPTKKILSLVRASYPSFPILVRCKDQSELEELEPYQPTKIIVETFEESLSMAQSLLHIIKIPAKEIIRLIENARSHHYHMLQKITTEIDGDLMTDNPPHCSLPIVLFENAYAVNRTLGELDLKEFGVEVIVIRRGHTRILNPDYNVKLHPNDIIVLYGAMTNIDDAEQYLLEGN